MKYNRLDSEHKTIKVDVRLLEPIHEELVKIAKIKGTTKSDEIREATSNHVMEHYDKN